MKGKHLSESQRIYYRTGINALLAKMQDGKEYFTFELGYAASYFNGKDNRPLLRKALRTLEADGLVENVKLPMNIHKWKITEKGKQTFIKN